MPSTKCISVDLRYRLLKYVPRHESQNNSKIHKMKRETGVDTGSGSSSSFFSFSATFAMMSASWLALTEIIVEEV